MTKLGRELSILLEVVLMTTKLVEIMAMEDVEPIQEDAPLLPHFNKGLPNALAFGHNSTFIAVEIGQGTVTWRGEDDPIELIVDYYCDATIVCQGEFSLNKSDKLVSILDYNTGGRSATDKLHRYTASVNLRAHRKYGFAIVVFKLAIRENLLLRDEARGQYIVHLQPPEDRVVTQGCKFKVNAHFDVNLMTLTFDPSDYMPSGLKWSKLVVYKQVRLKPKPTKSFLYVPLIVLTQSPFRVIPLNFYYFKEVILELGDGSRLLIKGTTVSLTHPPLATHTTTLFSHTHTHKRPSFILEMRSCLMLALRGMD